MSAVDKNQLAPTPAPQLPFTPTSAVPRSTVQAAIEYLSSLITALTSSLALAQYTADDARSIAMTARGMAREAQRVQQHDNAQPIFNSQVFN